MNISPVLQRTLNRAASKISKYSPQILTAVGIGGLVTAGVIAAKNTLKLEETLETARERIASVEDDASKTQAYAKNVFALAKLYGIPVTLAAGSIVSILVGHNILHKRNLALVAAYKGLEQAFSEYRRRVIEEHGEEADEKYRYGIKDVTTEVDGKKVKSQEIVPAGSPYLFRFDDTNDNWNSADPSHNLFYVTRAQQWFNDSLQLDGHVFLQDVTRHLGFPDSKVGAVTGWIYKKGTGDDYIDFKIKDLQDSHGYILLDFNVDGVILDLI
jgi:hypothetical protein